MLSGRNGRILIFSREFGMNPQILLKNVSIEEKKCLIHHFLGFFLELPETRFADFLRPPLSCKD